MLTPRELLEVARARRHGIVNPLIARQEAKRAGLEYAVACAVLMQETSGGHNIFGHDPTIWVGAGTVTKAKYLAYLKDRKASGQCQGVGPMQLTYFGFQDQADKLGGCYVVRWNMRVGFEDLASGIRSAGLFSALTAYNGSTEYASAVTKSVAIWRRYLA